MEPKQASRCSNCYYVYLSLRKMRRGLFLHPKLLQECGYMVAGILKVRKLTLGGVRVLLVEILTVILFIRLYDTRPRQGCIRLLRTDRASYKSVRTTGIQGKDK
jgi:hypothetical protein